MTPLLAIAILSAAPMPELDARFQSTTGWIGADGNYSVTLSKDRTLWFFSDTWLGDIENGKRKRARLINNSIGVMKASGPVVFAWGKEKTAFFQPEDSRGWLWPFAGVKVDETMHLILWQMEKAPGPAAFGFRNVAVWHAVIANPLDEPAKWRIKQEKLPFTETTPERTILFGSAMLTVDKVHYIYGVLEKPEEKLFGKKMILAKAESPGDFTSWRFRTADGWSDDFQKAEPLAAGFASEYSITHLPKRKLYAAITNDAFLSPKIVMRTAAEPWGPWSEAKAVFTPPEAKWGKEVFCYSAKAHAGLSNEKELVISYAANSHKMAEVLDDGRLYWPRFVSIKLGAAP